MFLMSALLAYAQPVQIILLRHAEKPAEEAALHLSSRGEKRAHALAKFLSAPNYLTSNAPIAALYATRVTKNNHSQRTGETLAPLAKKLHLPVNTAYESDRYPLLVHNILSNGAFHGKTVIICWTHHELADLAGALGVKPKPSPWKDKVFDRWWVIRLPDSRVEFQELPQHLLPGDSNRAAETERKR
jgi:hypothetical protein